MKKTISNVSLMIAVLFSSMVASAQTAKNWKVDNNHSSVRFTVTHLVISEVEGSFKVYDGTITNTKEDFTDAQIDFSLDAASVNTGNEMRDGHLKTDDFFNSEKYPKMTFKSTSFKKIKGNMYELIGDMIVRDVTKKVKFEVKYGGTAKDAYGNTKAGFKATGTINRFDFGMKWNGLTETGSSAVAPEVQIVCNLEFALAK